MTVILNFIGLKMTMNCDYDSIVGVILPVENKYCQLYNIEIDKNTPTFLHLCQKHSGFVFASGKNGSIPHTLQFFSWIHPFENYFKIFPIECV